jgi:hypothetical protein
VERFPHYREALSPDVAKTPENGVQRYIAAQRFIQTKRTLRPDREDHPPAGSAPPSRVAEPEPCWWFLFREDFVDRGEDVINSVQVEHAGEVPDVYCASKSGSAAMKRASLARLIG